MSAIHFAPDFRPRKIRHVFMDWDGTTSLTRGGWSEIMARLFAETLPPLPGETDDTLHSFSRDELMRLNGRPSIHQMSRLAELVEQRGGNGLHPDDYQREYQQRINHVVDQRLSKIRTSESRADSLLVPGVRALFEALAERGIGITLASGTPLPELLDEVRLMRLENHFADIFGPRDLEDRTFSKREILHASLKTHGLDGIEMLAFGDGPVELTEVRAVGGLAIAVAADETSPHRLDEWKRDTLLAAGAHAVIANFTALPELLAAFFPPA